MYNFKTIMSIIIWLIYIFQQKFTHSPPFCFWFITKNDSFALPHHNTMNRICNTRETNNLNSTNSTATMDESSPDPVFQNGRNTCWLGSRSSGRVHYRRVEKKAVFRHICAFSFSFFFLAVPDNPIPVDQETTVCIILFFCTMTLILDLK